jgi:hypothetical protein
LNSRANMAAQRNALRALAPDKKEVAELHPA